MPLSLQLQPNSLLSSCFSEQLGVLADLFDFFRDSALLLHWWSCAVYLFAP